MSIIYDEKQRTITLYTKNTAYQMQIDRYGFLLHLYYGKYAEGCMDYLLTYYDRGFSGNPYEAGTDKTYSRRSGPGITVRRPVSSRIRTAPTAVISAMRVTA